QLPATERDVEPLARQIERFEIVDGETNPASLLALQCDACPRDPVGAWIECVHERGTLGCERRQATLAAADIEHALAVEADEVSDRRCLDSRLVASLHLSSSACMP